MNNLRVRRILKTTIIDELVSSFVFRFLTRKSAELIRERGSPIAVFGNDWIGAHVFVGGVYEKELLDDFFGLLAEMQLDTAQMTIADVGANIGNHSIQFAKYFGKVFSFEPNPRTFEILDSNTKRLGNVKAFNCGLGRKQAQLTIKENWNNIGGSSAALNVRTDNTFDITVVSFDAMADAVGRIDAIKIDVEGMELEVLEGAERLISECHPIICLEQHESEFSPACNETPALDWLRAHGYRLFSLEAQKRRPWLIRRLRNVYQLFYGVQRERNIVEYPKLPKANYPMIFAVYAGN